MNRVVPFAMKFVGLEIDLGNLFIRDLSPNRELAVIQAAVTFKPLAVVVLAISRTTVS
jgi:hypothetical protein